MRKTVQLMVILTLLAWATQTLFHQWGFGGLILPNAQGSMPSGESVAAAPATRPAGNATLELRDEAVVRSAGEVTLRQVCRWDAPDSVTFAPVADLVVAKLDDSGSRKLNIEELRGALRRAGVNLAMVRLSGATACEIRSGNRPTQVMTDAVASAAASRASNAVDKDAMSGAAIAQEAAARDVTAPKALAPAVAQAAPAAEAETPAATPLVHSARADSAPSVPAPAGVIADQPVERMLPGAADVSLKDILIGRLAEQLGIEKNQLDVSFANKDKPILALTVPRCTFNIDTSDARSLGRITWQITADTPAGQRKSTLAAMARTWQDQLVVNRPVSRGQLILDRDVVQKRELTAEPVADALVNRRDVVGQQASSALEAGEVLTAGQVQPAPLVDAGDMMMVKLHLNRGTTIATVARALNGGGKGQTIRARNEANHDVYDVIVTAKQEGECTSFAGAATPASAVSAAGAVGEVGAGVATAGREPAIER
jgi:flagella basal body P-ring formation protein FlgA